MNIINGVFIVIRGLSEWNDPDREVQLKLKWFDFYYNHGKMLLPPAIISISAAERFTIGKKICSEKAAELRTIATIAETPASTNVAVTIG